ncbi:dispatched -like protein [Brachionus plicatilis]|uniref:Dispatched-like protein n=1 Tax=Brachionus plicatilis TaxID=10195 RepID=A0A3M7S9L6_BRAPC|nr:dispatched -like protein [Brachionus plicatilis]
MTECPDPHNDRLIQMQIQRCHSQIYHNNSIRSTKHINTTNFHYKLRRVYSTILVKYHYMVILVGILFAGLLTGLSFLKQPLPDIMDPSRGFGARGPGTLTSQLIVMKNVNSQLTKYNDYILDLYEKKKLQNISAEPKYDQNYDQKFDPKYDQNYDQKFDPNYDQKFDPKYDQNYDQKFDHYYDQNVDHYDYDNGTIYDLENGEKEASISKRQILYELSDEDELELLLNEVIYNNLKGDEIIGMLEPGELKMTKYPSVSQTYATCNFSSALDSNLEFYFHNKDNHDMLSVDNLKKLCQWDQSLRQSVNFSSNCYISLPRFIQLLNNKTKCEDIDESDVEHVRNVTKACHRLENSGVLYAFAETDRHKSDIIKLIDKKKPLNKFVRLAGLDQSICSYKNLMYIFYEFLVDKNFASTDKVSYSALVISNENKVYSNEFLFNYYYRNYHGSSYKLGDINGTELNAINLAGIRMEAAMRVIGAEMMLIAVAITLIVMVTLVYLRSIFISFIVNLGVVVSFGIAFFFYRIVFGIVLFPFLNMMAAFLLIGIACDNVYVLFDSWYTEKAKVIMEDLPDQLEACGNDDQAVLDKARPLPTIFIKKKFYKSKNFDCSDMPELYRELTQKANKLILTQRRHFSLDSFLSFKFECTMCFFL